MPVAKWPYSLMNAVTCVTWSRAGSFCNHWSSSHRSDGKAETAACELTHLLITKFGQDAEHFVARDVTAMILDFVLINCQRQLATVFGQASVGAAELASFPTDRVFSGRSTVNKVFRSGRAHGK